MGKTWFASPRFGILQRVIFLNVEGDPWPLVNPVITARNEEKIIVWTPGSAYLDLEGVSLEVEVPNGIY